ncbi:hypothetical protein VTJ83DRAFT_4687 [Remersonia thermophila]|uniref:Uncharacterized protein n=1 Tax=Remersonia thermophila TaxID=72144 RepID=A0ABR4DAQ1_9PEZI
MHHLLVPSGRRELRQVPGILPADKRYGCTGPADGANHPRRDCVLVPGTAASLHASPLLLGSVSKYPDHCSPRPTLFLFLDLVIRQVASAALPRATPPSGRQVSTRQRTGGNLPQHHKSHHDLETQRPSETFAGPPGERVPCRNEKRPGDHGPALLASERATLTFGAPLAHHAFRSGRRRCDPVGQPSAPETLRCPSCGHG